MTGFETVASQGTSRDTAAPEILTVTRFFPFKTIGNTASLNRCTVFCSMRQVIFSIRPSVDAATETQCDKNSRDCSLEKIYQLYKNLGTFDQTYHAVSVLLLKQESLLAALKPTSSNQRDSSDLNPESIF